MKRSILVLLFFSLAILFVTCNKHKEGPCAHEEAILHVKVYDNNGKRVDSALINVFDSYENYEKARLNKNDSSFAIFTIRSDSANEVKIPITPYKNCWVLVTLYDTAQFQQLSSELTTSKMDPLQSCSDYHISIFLTPLGSNVGFWTPLGTNLPIAIQFNSKIDTLRDSSVVIPTDPGTPAYPRQLVFPVKSGTYEYQASSSNGCSWQGQVTVKDGEYLPVKLEPCVRTLVAFYVDASSSIAASKFPISIFLDNSTVPSATINGPYTGPVFSGSCINPSNLNVVYVYLEPGVVHSYKAVSQAGATTPCNWGGNTSILNTNCSFNPAIKLGTGCN